MIRFPLFSALCLGACTPLGNEPTDGEMDRVDAALRRLPCVGDLNDWDRRYFYHPIFSSSETARALEENRTPKPTSYLRSIVEIDLRQANFAEFGRGRKGYSDFPPGSGDNDDRHYRMVLGSYDLISGKLDMLHCGENVSPP